MPILYACLINERRCVVTEAFGTSKVGPYQRTSLDYFDEMKEFGRHNFSLSAEQSLSYRHQRKFAFICISDTYDIKEAEAQKFLEALE